MLNSNIPTQQLVTQLPHLSGSRVFFLLQTSGQISACIITQTVGTTTGTKSSFNLDIIDMGAESLGRPKVCDPQRHQTAFIRT